MTEQIWYDFLDYDLIRLLVTLNTQSRVLKYDLANYINFDFKEVHQYKSESKFCSIAQIKEVIKIDQRKLSEEEHRILEKYLTNSNRKRDFAFSIRSTQSWYNKLFFRIPTLAVYWGNIRNLEFEIAGAHTYEIGDYTTLTPAWKTTQVPNWDFEFSRSAYVVFRDLKFNRFGNGYSCKNLTLGMWHVDPTWPIFLHLSNVNKTFGRPPTYKNFDFDFSTFSQERFLKENNIRVDPLALPFIRDTQAEMEFLVSYT